MILTPLSCPNFQMEVTLTTAYLVNLLILFIAGSVESHFQLAPIFFRGETCLLWSSFNFFWLRFLGSGRCFQFNGSVPGTQMSIFQRFLSSFLNIFLLPCSEMFLEARLSDDIVDGWSTSLPVCCRKDRAADSPQRVRQRKPYWWQRWHPQGRFMEATVSLGSTSILQLRKINHMKDNRKISALEKLAAERVCDILLLFEVCSLNDLAYV